MADPPLIVFVAAEEERLAGFLELDLRSYGEGCSSFAGAIRRRLVRSAGLETARRRRRADSAAEQWSRERGYAELASDTEEFNRLSRDAHAALGFEEVETLVVFRKAL